MNLPTKEELMEVADELDDNFSFSGGAAALLRAIARGDLVVCEPVLHVCDDTHGDPVATGVEYRPATSIPEPKT
jgi:hypothetical protein